jgi:hypothetical protein
LSLCCKKSKSIDSIYALNTFRCLVISSGLLSSQFIFLFIWSFRRSLCALVYEQWKRMWSIVWSSLPQMHFASSRSLKRWRYALILPCPDSTAVSFGVRLIFIPSLSRTDGKYCFLPQPWVMLSILFAICVCVYVCMYVCMDGWMDGCRNVCVCMYACMDVCVYACTSLAERVLFAHIRHSHSDFLTNVVKSSHQWVLPSVTKRPLNF